MISLCFIYIHSQTVSSCPLRYVHIFSPTALHKLLHPWKSKHMLQFLQQLQCSKFAKLIHTKQGLTSVILFPFCYLSPLSNSLPSVGSKSLPSLQHYFSVWICIINCSKWSSFSVFFLPYITRSLYPKSG